MARMKIDNRIINLVKKCVDVRQRSMFFILGGNAHRQIVILYHLLSKFRDNLRIEKPSILWCYKKDLGFRIHHHKKLRSLRKKYIGKYTMAEEDMFDHFLLSTDINFCHYSGTTTVLGQTFGMLIVQDFEAITPNILAHIIECVEGCGIIIFLLPDIHSLKELCFLNMDVHSRYLTDAHTEICHRFNKRFVLSLTSCANCIVVDNQLHVLLNFNDTPDMYQSCHLQHKGKGHLESTLQKLKEHSPDFLNRHLSLCYTSDQANALLIFTQALLEKKLHSVVSLTSSRGRGKSAVLGLALSVAFYLKYSNIYVTSPYLENLQTLFIFLIKGLCAFQYKENYDYNVECEECNNIKLISGIKSLNERKKFVTYLTPANYIKTGNADLVAIDEASAIPLPLVKKWMESNSVFMASTINGYEGTGRSLSLKLLNQLRKQSTMNVSDGNHTSFKNEKTFVLHEITLNEAVRYSDGDKVEEWINNLFCLEAIIPRLISAAPTPEMCQLYYVNRDILFSYHKAAENFLQDLVALFISSHYKNSPNDLLMIADAPSHHIFCLLPPVDVGACHLPNILCAIQVSLEGRISQGNVIQELSHGKRASGDLIPWIISQQFQDDNFPSLSGARIVRIATHPDYQRMGYGRHALELLCMFYERKNLESCESLSSSNSAVDEEAGPQNNDCLQKGSSLPLLLKLSETKPENLDYLGVSYGLTAELFRFWKKAGFLPLYLRQTTSDITGEHSCVMVKNLKCDILDRSQQITDFALDFRERFINLLTTAFRNLPTSLALNILHCNEASLMHKKGASSELKLSWFLSPCSIRRLSAYCSHQVDYHLIMDLLPLTAKLYFSHHLKGYFLSSVQEGILLSIGLQNKSIEDISTEHCMETGQVMGLFMKTMKKILHSLNSLNSTDSSWEIKEISKNHVKNKWKSGKCKNLFPDNCMNYAHNYSHSDYKSLKRRHKGTCEDNEMSKRKQ